MASFDTTADATHSRFTRQHLLDPHQLTLGSVAESFRQEEYEPAPPGVDPEEWRRLVRRERNPNNKRREGDSLLDERLSTTTGSRSRGDEYSYTSTSQQPLQPSTSSSAGGGVNTYDSSLYSNSNSQSLSQSQEQSQEHSHSTEQSDRTELLSQRLKGEDGNETAADQTGDSAASSFLGKRKEATTTIGRTGGGGGNLGNGQNMTLREQEKVSSLSRSLFFLVTDSEWFFEG